MISGFLITLLLVSEVRRSGGLSLKGFYAGESGAVGLSSPTM